MKNSVRTVTDLRADLGEGPCWNAEEGRIYWVDIEAGIIHSTDPVSGSDRAINAGEKIGSVVMNAAGGFLVAGEKGFASIGADGEGLTRIADPEKDNPDTRFNDGKCDPAGRYWAGSLSYSRTAGSAALYCLDTDGTLTRRVEGVTVSNGLAWDTDKSRMYYIDTPTRSVVAFDWDRKSGEISAPRIQFTVPAEAGSPDGMTIDAEGMLWIAFFRGGCVTRRDPESGRILEQIDLPAPNVTSCCFGGPKLETLFITTARHAMDQAALQEHPLAGALFACEPGITGTPSYRYGG